MPFNSKMPVAINYFLEPGFIYLATKPTVISAVLGSCVSVCVFDRKKRIGGINHFQYPFIYQQNQATARYGNIATQTLIRMMVDNGSRIKHLEAQIIGGAYNPHVSSRNVGEENARIARKVLAKERVALTSEDVGGELGRKIIFNTLDNEIAVLKVQNLRGSDWFPYEGRL
jgi:chemotaxis protein CheD